MTCEKCGIEIEIGLWPFCPHPPTGNYTNFRDEIPGGITLENYGPHPVTFYSHSERRAWMAKNNLNEKETWAPFPGTDKDPMGIPNPAGYMDPYTLENARILISRNGRKEFDPVSSGVLANQSAEVVADANAMRRALGQETVSKITDKE